MRGDVLPSLGREAVHLAGRPGDLDPLLGEGGAHCRPEVGDRVDHRHPLLRGTRAGPDGTGDDDLVAVSEPPDEQAALLAVVGGPGAVADLEIGEVRHRLDPCRRSRLRPRSHPYHDAVVVEREAVDRRLVPGGELVARPVGMDPGQREDPVDQQQIAGDAAHPAPRQGARPLAEDHIGVAVAEATRDVGVAAADDRQVAGEGPLGDTAADEHLGLEQGPGAEGVERRGGGQELGVRGEDAQLVGSETEDALPAREVDDADPHGARRASRHFGLLRQRLDERRLGTDSLPTRRAGAPRARRLGSGRGDGERCENQQQGDSAEVSHSGPSYRRIVPQCSGGAHSAPKPSASRPSTTRSQSGAPRDTAKART